MAMTVLTTSEAVKTGLGKNKLYALEQAGALVKIGRGVFVNPDQIDPQYWVIAAAARLNERATLCLVSALVHYGLVDDIPAGCDVALPLGSRTPAGFWGANWHRFGRASFDIGRQTLVISPEISVGIYSKERCIVDCFRLKHLVTAETAYTALRRWYYSSGASPAKLLEVAEYFPKTIRNIHHALEVLQ